MSKQTILKSFIIILFTSLMLTSCIKADLEDQEVLDSLRNSEIDKIQLNYKSDGDKVIEIKANDSNFNNIIELSSNIKLKSKSNKKHLPGDIIIVKFYSKDDMKLMLQLIDGHIFVNAYQYKYSDYSKDSAATLEKILTSYFNIK